MSDAQHPAWHQALAYATTGELRPELGQQASPNLPVLAELLRDAPEHPSVVPDDLMTGIGPAQFAAALTQLRAELRWRRSDSAPVISDRMLDHAERRLVDDAPPHH